VVLLQAIDWQARWLWRAVLLFLSAVLLGSTVLPVFANERGPVSTPTQLTPLDGISRQRPAVAFDTSGNAVVVWQRTTNTGRDIFMQRFSPTGSPLSAELQVNNFTANNQQNPAVAVAPNGTFVVVWDGAGSGDTQGIWMRRFSAAGVALTTDELVNRPINGPQRNPQIAMDATGAFIIAWEGEVRTSNGILRDPSGVAYRRFTADGFARDGADQLPYDPPSSFSDCSTVRRSPSVALQPNGAFALSWEEERCDPETFDLTYGIFAQRFTTTGGRTGSLLTLATATNGATVGMPSSAFHADGSLLTAWEWRPDGGAQALIEAATVSSTGAVSAIRTVSGTGLLVRRAPRVVVDASDTAAITWMDQGLQNGATLGVALQLFTPSGVPIGERLAPALPAPASNTTVSHVALAVAPTADADLLVLWDTAQSLTSAVYGRAYRAAGVAITQSSTTLTPGEAAADLVLGLRTLPASDVLITLQPQSSLLQLGGAAPGAALQLTFTGENALQAQVVAVQAPSNLTLSEATLSEIAVQVSSADPTYNGVNARVLINGSPGTTISFTVNADPNIPPTATPTVTPTRDPLLPTFTPTTTPTVTPTRDPLLPTFTPTPTLTPTPTPTRDPLLPTFTPTTTPTPVQAPNRLFLPLLQR
jgi:hypothetical protein